MSRCDADHLAVFVTIPGRDALRRHLVTHRNRRARPHLRAPARPGMRPGDDDIVVGCSRTASASLHGRLSDKGFPRLTCQYGRCGAGILVFCDLPDFAMNRRQRREVSRPTMACCGGAFANGRRPGAPLQGGDRARWALGAPVSDAITRLPKSLIDVFPQHGSFVALIRAADVRESLFVRMALGQAMRRLAPAADAALLGRLDKNTRRRPALRAGTLEFYDSTSAARRPVRAIETPRPAVVGSNAPPPAPPGAPRCRPAEQTLTGIALVRSVAPRRRIGRRAARRIDDGGAPWSGSCRD